MINRLPYKFASACVFLVSLVACKRDSLVVSVDVPSAVAAPLARPLGDAAAPSASRAPERPKEPEQTDKESDPSKIALKWIEALRSRDVMRLTALSRLPFSFKDTGTEGDCKSSESRTEMTLSPVLACLARDPLLNEDLKANPDAPADVISVRTLPNWARKWKKQLSATATPVSVYLPGNGDAFDLVLIVVGDAVQGLWKHTTFEKN